MMRWLTLFAIACGPTPQRFVTYPSSARTTPLSPLTVGQWSVTFDDARLAFGPVYFCAASSAKPELCETAVAEITRVTAIDLRSTDTFSLGEVYGLTGEIRSVNFDYGLSWLSTQSQAQPAPEAPDGHSAVFRGVATRGGTSIRFEVAIDIVPATRGLRAALGARTGTNVKDDRYTLDVTFEPAAWWSAVDFDELANKGGDPVVITPDMQAYTALVIAMQANFPPTMHWSAK